MSDARQTGQLDIAPAPRLSSAADSVLRSRRLCSFSFRFDRLAFAFHFNTASLGLFAFRQRHAQHPVAVIGVRAFSRNGIRQRERPQETAIRALYTMVVVRVFFLLEMPLAAKRDHVVLN